MNIFVDHQFSTKWSLFEFIFPNLRLMPILHRGTKCILLFFSKDLILQSRGVITLFICLPLLHMEGIVLICNIDLYWLTGIFNSTGDMFKR